MRPVEPEDFRDVLAQFLDKVTHAADAELAKVSEVFSDLRRIKVEFVCEGLRRDRLYPGCRQRVQTAQVNAQAIGRQF
jgi:hypothetical protein